MITARVKELDNGVFEGRMSEVVCFPLSGHESVQHRHEKKTHIIIKAIPQEN